MPAAPEEPSLDHDPDEGHLNLRRVSSDGHAEEARWPMQWPRNLRKRNPMGGHGGPWLPRHVAYEFTPTGLRM